MMGILEFVGNLFSKSTYRYVLILLVAYIVLFIIFVPIKSMVKYQMQPTVIIDERQQMFQHWSLPTSQCSSDSKVV